MEEPASPLLGKDFLAVTLDWIEIFGFVTGVICVWLYAIDNVLAWPVGLANSTFFIILFAGDRLYADVILQAVYIVLGLYGWYMWLHGGKARAPLAITRTTLRQWSIFFFVFLATAIAMAELLVWFARVSSLPPPSIVYWDSTTTAACFIAQYMLAKKLIENWIVWIVTNVSYIALYLVKDRPLIAFLQIIFIVLSVRGYRHWRKEMS